MVNATSKCNRTVLIVDDDPSVLRALRRLIKSAGLAVETFASAQELLSSGRAQPAGCLVLDVRMPGISGPELQEKLNAAGSALPIIFMTAHEDADTCEAVMRAGASDFLQKPFDDQRLLDAVDAALDQRSREDQDNRG